MKKLILPDKECPVCRLKFNREKGKSIADFKEKVYCSRKCYFKHNTKENHWYWKGGKGINSEGYVRINVSPNKRKFEHRLVMENHLNRKLRKGEQVHHINGNKLDNRIENLLLTKNGEHRKLYHQDAKRNKKGQFTK